MSPEERAKTVCTILEADTGARLEGDDWATLERLVVEEIRAAENEALERAAGSLPLTTLAAGGGAMSSDDEVFFQGVEWAAGRIRSLKHVDSA